MAELLARHRFRLVGYFARKARGIRQHESPEDLAQGVHLHAIAHQEQFDYQGERQFVGWMLQIARQYLQRRIEHWGAAKRDAGPMMRITFGVDTSSHNGLVRMPADEGPGPITHASQREELDLASRAIDGLPPRDRELVRMISRDVPTADMAQRLGISPEAAQKAKRRAIERFRKIYTILERQHPG